MTPVQLALVDVGHAFQVLEFAIKLLCHCELGHLDRASFDADVLLRFPNENLDFPSGTFDSNESVVLAAKLNVSICFGVTALALNAAYDEAGITNRPTSRDPSDELRTLVYMVRCAFAHNPANPCWNAKGDFARVLTLSVCDPALNIDLAALHNRPFDYADIGGFPNWMKIRVASEAQLAAL